MNPILVILIIVAIMIIGRNYLRNQQDQARKKEIMAHSSEWGVEVCETIYQRKVAVNMTQNMVLLAWGKPTSIDQREVTTKSQKERWVYGKKGAARYVSFTNSRVSKITTS